MTILFWVCIAGAVYSYLLYPLLLKLIPKRVPGAPVDNFAPVVTIVVACRNEQRRLPHKLENTLACMFETRAPLRPTRYLLESAALQQNYDDVWAGFPKAAIPQG